MEKYPGLFIKTALIYLLIGVIVGVVIGTDPMLAARFRFVHIHLNMLGFMIMIIAGVAYHVLPRFTARTMPWPVGVKYHFYLQNIGLLGMLGTKLTDNIWKDDGKSLFLLFAVVTASALFIMVYNLFCVLLPKRSTVQLERITPNLNVAEALDRFPKAREVFLQAGLDALANPTACAQFPKGMTIKDICEKHDLEVESFVKQLNQKVSQCNSNCEDAKESRMHPRKDCQEDCFPFSSP